MLRKNVLLLVLSVFAMAAMQAQETAEKELTYTTTMKGGGQEMEFDVVRSFETAEGKLIITDKTSTPFGSSENISVIDAENYATISQSSTGFMTSNFDYTDNRIKGESADFQGNKTPIDIETEGEVYGGGSAMEMYLNSLPLEVGYEMTISTFSPFVMQVIEMQLEVAEKESVEVPGGTFETYRLDLTIEEAEDFSQSLWITMEEPRMMIKSVMNAPQMGEMTTVYSGTKEKKKKKKKKK